jgi:hypothetical protein
MEQMMEHLLAKVKAKKDSFVGKIMAIIKASLEEMKSVAEHQDVPKEEASVKTVGALENQYLAPASSHRAPPTAEEKDPG